MNRVGVRRARTWIVALALVASSWPASGGQGDPPLTLRTLLAREHVDPAGLSLFPDLPIDRGISNEAFTNTPEVFAVAFYWDDVVQRDRHLPSEFDILLLEKAAARWTRATLSADRLPRTAAMPNLPLWGSIVGVTHTPRHLLVEAHVSPSAAATLVLTRSLEPKAVFYGWPLFGLQGGAVAYYRSQVHFAPTHPFELCVFDPDSGADRLVYTVAPNDAPRRAFVEQMRAAYRAAGEAWCRNHNHHCEPERFDSDGGRPWTVDPATDSAAFVVTFGNAPGARGGSPDDAVPRVQVAVVCRHTTRIETIACSETPLDTLKRAHPGLSTLDLLKLAMSASKR